ncbi:MAG: Rrf2 family transcriptional regulator [Candidatus Marinimicrobia bacterium]|nr:Rrf2 family transcriptional regulator [Candidatus Neomarinimicrobiota bacterium]MDP7059477.1 Rrf2 family transcriptional regulator [Candidatus Neomarinimicrobiota bacterium]
MIFSKSAEYAIQAMIYLADKQAKINPEKPIMVREIAEAYSIPAQFLAKITQTLAKHHLLNTTRGRGGGIKLSRPASTIFLPEVVHAIDGPPSDQDECIFGLDLCSDDQPCPFHHQWKPIRNDIRSMMATDNLARLAKRVAEKHDEMNSKKAERNKKYG